MKKQIDFGKDSRRAYFKALPASPAFVLVKLDKLGPLIYAPVIVPSH
jgi:hypothetical protein